ncbi:MAG: CapA family protein [Oscillospiraceae bacterium]|nr:CapA family protein [Oscillospiraceae bacterium]
MAIDPEEMKRRRLQKQQQRESQQVQRKKLMIRLGIASGVLLLCGILIFALSRPDAPSPQSPTEKETVAPAPTQPTEIPPTTTVHLAFAGDLIITDNVVNSGGADLNYSKVFGDVAPVLANADMAVLNLEGSLYGAPYGTQTASAPLSMMEALDDAGVDLIQLANSYSIYHGISGLGQTIDRVRSAGMEPLGVWPDTSSYQKARGFTLRNVNGLKIAFVAFTKGMVDGMALPAGSENCVNILYEDYDSTYQNINTEKITQVMKSAAREDPDAIVVLLHWGSKESDTVSSSQKRILNLLQELGADAVIGTHPIYLQQMSMNENGQFVAYSLGSFYSDAQDSGMEYSVILDLAFTKDNKSGKTTISGYDYTPIYTAKQDGLPVRVVRIKETMAAYENNYIEKVSEADYNAMAYALERIEARIKGE